MSALREVLARFSVEVDDRPLTEVDRKLDRLKQNFQRFASIAAASALAVGGVALKLVQAASEVEESSNRLRETFKQNTQEVIDWSETHAKAIGRSRFDLQKYAGDFGQFLAPVFAGTEQDITGMSTQLSALAVDLASFADTSDEEAKMRLFSGLSGETEAVRMLGINIADERLQQLNKQINGEKAIFKNLSFQEKTLLRLRAIMIDTVDKQGDAKRTADSWANSVKRIEGTLKTQAAMWGQRLMPTAKKALDFVENAIDEIIKGVDFLTKKTRGLENAVLAVATAFTVVKLQQWVSLLSAVPLGLWKGLAVQAGMFAAHMALAAAAFLIVDDLLAAIRGDESVFGGMLEELKGIKDMADALAGTLNRIVTLVKNIGRVIYNTTMRALRTDMSPWASEEERAPGRRGVGGLFTGVDFDEADKEERQRNEGREAARRLAIETGDVGLFRTQRRSTENQRDTENAYNEGRRAYLKANPTVEPNVDDVKNLGVDYAAWRKAEGEAAVSRPEAPKVPILLGDQSVARLPGVYDANQSFPAEMTPNPTLSGQTMSPVNATMSTMINMTITGNGSAEQIGSAVAESVSKPLQKAAKELSRMGAR